MRSQKGTDQTPEGKVKGLINSRYVLLSLGIFVLAFSIRLVYLLQIESSLPFFHAPILDELYHDTWARQIVSGNWIGAESFFRAPLYPYFLALVYKVFGYGPFIPRLFQIILGSASCVLVFLIAQEVFNRFVGVLSGVIAALYAMLVYYDGQLLYTSLIVFLDLSLIGLLILTAERPKPWKWLLCGVVLGISAIARPDVLVFLPFILIWMFVRFKRALSWRAVLIRWVVICFGVLIPIAPVAVRNYLLSKDLVLIAWQGGYNFYLGNNPQASGWSVLAPQIEPTLVGGINDAVRLAEGETKTRMKPSEVSGFWYAKGIDFVLSEPLDWLKLTAKKTLYFWKGYEIANDQNPYLYKEFSSVFDALLGKHIIYLPFGLIGPLSILGIVICLRNPRKYLILYLFVFSYSAAVILFFVCSRFRMPVIPFLIMFASFSTWWFIEKIKSKKILGLLVWVAVVVGLVFALNTNLESLQGNQQALDHFNLGCSFRQMGRIDSAIAEWEISLRYNPHLNLARINLAHTFFETGLTDSAIAHYNAALISDTSYHDYCYYDLGAIFHSRGDLDKAIEFYLKSLEANPRFEPSLLLLGQAYYEKGWLQRAREEWERVLELNPDNEKAKRALGRK